MSSIEIQNASVSYFLQHKGKKRPDGLLEQGPIGAQLIQRRRYIEIAALKDITLSMRQGDRIGLIGLNGSGKSTLLKLCSGALTVKSGSITIDGRISAQFSLGAGVRPTLSGRRNVELKCLYAGTPQRSIAERVKEVKALSNLGGYFELPVSSYSAGMRSRLVMSMIRLVRPEILVMDEWIGAADGSVNKIVQRLQRDLLESASLVIMASHSERILRQWATTVVWLDAGEVKAVGPVDEIYPQFQQYLASREA